MQTWKQDGYRVYSNCGVVGMLTDEEYRAINSKVHRNPRVILAAINRVVIEFGIGVLVGPTVLFYLAVLSYSSELLNDINKNPDDAVRVAIHVVWVIATAFCIVRCALTDCITSIFKNAEKDDIRGVLVLPYVGDIRVVPHFVIMETPTEARDIPAYNK